MKISKIFNSITIVSLVFVLAVPVVFAQTPAATSSNQMGQGLNFAQDNYKAAQKDYLQSLNNYKSSRADFMKIKDEYQILKDKKLKNLAKKKLEDKSKNFVVNAINALIKNLQALKNKVENAPKISDSDKTEILNEINGAITKFQGKLTNANSLTPQQIVDLTKGVKNDVKVARYLNKKVSGLLMAARVNYVIGRLDGASAKVSSKLADLKSIGKDTATLEKEVADMNSLISQAKDKLSQAKDKFMAINSVDNAANKLFKDGKTLLKSANNLVIKAHKALVHIIDRMTKLVGQEQQDLNKLKGLKPEEKTTSTPNK